MRTNVKCSQLLSADLRMIKSVDAARISNENWVIYLLRQAPRVERWSANAAERAEAVKDHGSLGEQVVHQQEAGPEEEFPQGLGKHPLLHANKLSPKIQQGLFDFGTQSPGGADLSTSLQGS